MNLSIPSWAQVTNSSPGGTGVVIRNSTCLATGVDVVVAVPGADVVVVCEQAVIAGTDINIISETRIANNTDSFILCV